MMRVLLLACVLVACLCGVRAVEAQAQALSVDPGTPIDVAAAGVAEEQFAAILDAHVDDPPVRLGGGDDSSSADQDQDDSVDHDSDIVDTTADASAAANARTPDTSTDIDYLDGPSSDDSSSAAPAAAPAEASLPPLTDKENWALNEMIPSPSARVDPPATYTLPPEWQALDDKITNALAVVDAASQDRLQRLKYATQWAAAMQDLVSELEARSKIIEASVPGIQAQLAALGDQHETLAAVAAQGHLDQATAHIAAINQAQSSLAEVRSTASPKAKKRALNKAAAAIRQQ